MTKRIAIVANTTWNIYNFRLNVIRKFLDEGYEVIVFSPIDKYIEYQTNFAEVTHVAINHLDRDGTNPLQDISLIVELFKYYKHYRPDITIHYTIKPNIYGAIASKLSGIPSVGIITGLGYSFLHQGLIRQVTKRLYKLACMYHHQVIFENLEDRELFIQKGLVSPEKSISIKGCGVNTSHFRPMSNGRYLQKTIFSFIGRLLYDKGLVEFVEAANRVKAICPDAEFWIIGDIDDKNPAAIKKDDLIKWVKSDSVIYKGYASDVREYIRHSDCIVLPSYREAIARSLTEAMSMEKPIITTDTAGCREAVEEGKNGFLIPVKDSTALRQAMIKFINCSPADRRAMGRYGRKKVLSEFDDQKIAQDIFDIVAKI